MRGRTGRSGSVEDWREVEREFDGNIKRECMNLSRNTNNITRR